MKRIISCSWKRICVLFFLSALAVTASYADSTVSKDQLNVAEMWEITGLDPAKNGTFTKEKAMITETLVIADENFNFVPNLAESWKMKNDTLWEFQLKKGVLFHNGSELNAKAVVDSINRALQVNPFLKKLTNIKKTSAKGKYTVLFETQGLYPLLPATLVYSDLSIISSDSAQNPQGIIVHPIGTGPYFLKEWKQAQQTVILERNNAYWGQKPQIKTVVFRSIPEPSTRSLEIQQGRIDFIADAPYGDMALLKKRGLNVIIESTARLYQLNFGKLKNTPFENIKVRQAISHAINREEIVKYVLFGMGKPAVGVFEDQMSFAEKGLTPYAFSPDKARLLLKEAGWIDADGDKIVEKNNKAFITTLYTYPQRPGLKPMAMAIQSQLQQIGIQVAVRIMDWSAISETMKDGDMRLAAFSTAMIPDPDYYLRSTFAANGNSNTWKYQNASVDSLLSKGIITTEANKRMEIYKGIQQIVHHDVPIIPISYYGVNIVMKPQIKGFVFNPTAHDYMLSNSLYIK